MESAFIFTNVWRHARVSSRCRRKDRLEFLLATTLNHQSVSSIIDKSLFTSPTRFQPSIYFDRKISTTIRIYSLFVQDSNARCLFSILYLTFISQTSRPISTFIWLTQETILQSEKLFPNSYLIQELKFVVFRLFAFIEQPRYFKLFYSSN